MNKIFKWDEINGSGTQEEKMEAFLDQRTDTYAILQLRYSEETAMEMFSSTDNLKKMGREPDIDHYELVYVEPMVAFSNHNQFLEDVYTRFNMDRPSDFTGHSLSVSDIVAIQQQGVITCHYVEPVGFKELPDLIRRENYLKNAEMMLEDDYNSLDGIINNGRKDEEEERNSVLGKLKEAASQSEFPPQPARRKDEREL